MFDVCQARVFHCCEKYAQEDHDEAKTRKTPPIRSSVKLDMAPGIREVNAASRGGFQKLCIYFLLCIIS